MRVWLNDNNYFVPENCLKFNEDTRWDGRNHISLATNSQWAHEYLYFTKSGRWVLTQTSQWQGSQDTNEIVSSATAFEWLLRMNTSDDEISRLPEAIQKEIRATLVTCEI